MLDQGSDDCNDGLVISGFGSGEAFESNLPPTDDEDLYPTFFLVKDKTLSTSGFQGGYKAQTSKTVRPKNHQSSDAVGIPVPPYP